MEREAEVRNYSGILIGGVMDSGILRQGEELGPKQAEALAAPPNKQKYHIKFTLEFRESKEGFLGGSAGLPMSDMLEIASD